MKEKYEGILDLTPSLDCTLANMAATMDLPYLSVFGRNCMVEGTPMSLTIKPADDVYLAAATRLAIGQLEESTYHIAIFHDSTFGEYCKSTELCVSVTLILIWCTNNFAHTDMDIIPSGEIDRKGALFFLARMDREKSGTNIQLQNIRKDMAVRTFIVMSSVENAENILNAVSSSEHVHVSTGGQV